MDDNLFKNYNIMIIMSENKISFIDIEQFDIIMTTDFFKINNSFFFI